jgi:DNA invertase Pin-like site-specific DNA recombinase
MEDAISYKRFSSRKQAKGDSQRRQTDLTEEYCQRHRLRLIDTYLDAGLSGFTGENLSDGSALTALLQAARAGRFKLGTRLIVESLDRLSRSEISMAVRLFLDILDTGLVIVTLIDGEQVFTTERVNSDLTALIIAIVYLSRANNESRNRRERALQAQQAARKKARERKTPITAECPYWLTLKKTGKTRRFVVRADRAAVVGQIFQMVVEGVGQMLIARFLNHHHVATFSGKPKWRPGMIAHLIRNQAVVGRFQPHLSIIENGKRRRVLDPDGPIEDYFPAIISEALYNQARLATKSRSTRTGGWRVPAYGNLVVRLGRCAVCGAPLHHDGSRGTWTYLRCADRHDQQCSNRFGFPYQKLEAVLLALDDLMELVARINSDILSVGLVRGRQLNDAQQQAHRIELAERKAFLERFKATKRLAQSTDMGERELSRHMLIVELRKVVEGAVLHPDRTLTLHMKPDALGRCAVYVLDHQGIQGVQITAPHGTTGFINRPVLLGLVQPVNNRGQNTGKIDGEGEWRPDDLVELLERVRIVYSPEGDWQAVALDPMQVSQVVLDAKKALAARWPDTTAKCRCCPRFVSDVARGCPRRHRSDGALVSLAIDR